MIGLQNMEKKEKKNSSERVMCINKRHTELPPLQYSNLFYLSGEITAYEVGISNRLPSSFKDMSHVPKCIL